MVRPDQDRIGGTAGDHVEVDETYVGGKTRGEGRGVHHKTLVAAAVEVRHRKPGTAQDKRKDGRYAGRVRLAIAPDRSAELLCGFVGSAVMPGTLLVTDDWSAYGSLRARGYDHHAIAECGDPEIAEEFLPISHLVFSNLKTWLNGIHHGVSAKHLQAYLNEFTFRFILTLTKERCLHRMSGIVIRLKNTWKCRLSNARSLSLPVMKKFARQRKSLPKWSKFTCNDFIFAIETDPENLRESAFRSSPARLVFKKCVSIAPKAIYTSGDTRFVSAVMTVAGISGAVVGVVIGWPVLQARS